LSRILDSKPAAERLEHKQPATQPTGATWWGDNWVKDDFSIKVLVDPMRPILHVQGDIPIARIKPVIEVRAEGRLIGRIELDGSAQFERQFSLAQLQAEHAGQYVTFQFLSNISFNPKKDMGWPDNRNLSWRLLKIDLIDRR
jgi:hypothetical protein